MRVQFERDGSKHRGKVIATIVEEKDVSINITKQIVRFVVLLKDGTFTSVPMNECQKIKWWKCII
jgi:hypothetical protein